jgi:hypothetical protein
MAEATSAIPAGVYPYLTVKGGKKAIDFYVKAFGAKARRRVLFDHALLDGFVDQAECFGKQRFRVRLGFRSHCALEFPHLGLQPVLVRRIDQPPFLALSVALQG